MHYIREETKTGKKQFSFYSDSCGGQNRNKHVLALLWYALNTLGLTEIMQTYFVSGHSQNEADGVHSRIEQTSDKIDIFTTPQWASCIRSARRKPPMFQVNEMDLKDFWDIKEISNQIKNFDLDTNRMRISWLKVKRIRIKNTDPNVIDMSYDYEDNSWFQLSFSQRGRRQLEVPDTKCIVLKQLRNEYIPVDEDKLRDLDVLCTKNLIPSVHHSFFKDLNH